jgi:hypothetical protein
VSAHETFVSFNLKTITQTFLSVNRINPGEVRWGAAHDTGDSFQRTRHVHFVQTGKRKQAKGKGNRRRKTKPRTRRGFNLAETEGLGSRPPSRKKPIIFLVLCSFCPILYTERKNDEAQ